MRLLRRLPGDVDGGNAYGFRGVNTQGLAKDANNAEDRDHHEKRNDAPDHNVFTLFLFLFIALVEDIDRKSPEKGEECEGLRTRIRRVRGVWPEEVDEEVIHTKVGYDHFS